MKTHPFYNELSKYLQDIESEFHDIPESRTETLQLLGNYVITSLKDYRQAKLVFICTHNSRRSQLGQIWALTAANFYGIENVRTFSGGTGSTAFNPRAVAAVERAGFSVEKQAGNSRNPRYIIKSSDVLEGRLIFSKKYDDNSNPVEGFCAVMVCSDADEACPIVPGAVKRISMTYDDPKTFDGTEQESIKYDERCRQIAREMCYLFDHIRVRIY